MESLHAIYKKFSCMFPSLSSDSPSLPIVDDWVDYSKEGQISPKKKPDAETKTKSEIDSTAPSVSIAEIPILSPHEKRMLAHREKRTEQKRRIEELDKQLAAGQISVVTTARSSPSSSSAGMPLEIKSITKKPPETIPVPPQPILFSGSSSSMSVPEKRAPSLMDLTEQPGAETIVPVPEHANPVPQPSPVQSIEQPPVPPPIPILTTPPISPAVVLDPRTSAHRKGY